MFKESFITWSQRFNATDMSTIYPYATHKTRVKFQFSDQICLKISLFNIFSCSFKLNNLWLYLQTYSPRYKCSRDFLIPPLAAIFLFKYPQNPSNPLM